MDELPGPKGKYIVMYHATEQQYSMDQCIMQQNSNTPWINGEVAEMFQYTNF
jgi:hypothetical protein